MPRTELKLKKSLKRNHAPEAGNVRNHVPGLVPANVLNARGRVTVVEDLDQEIDAGVETGEDPGQEITRVRKARRKERGAVTEMTERIKNKSLVTMIKKKLVTRTLHTKRPRKPTLTQSIWKYPTLHRQL